MNRATRSFRVQLCGAGALALALTALVLMGARAHAAASPPALEGVVNLNSATAEELRLLPGVGRARADAILAIRKRRGGFKSLDELTQVKGIGKAMLERLRPHLTLSGRTTAGRPTAHHRAPPAKRGGASGHR